MKLLFVLWHIFKMIENRIKIIVSRLCVCIMLITKNDSKNNQNYSIPFMYLFNLGNIIKML